MFPHLSFGEWIVLLIVVLLLVGPQRLPDVAASVGKSIKSFKEGLRENEDASKNDSKKKE